MRHRIKLAAIIIGVFLYHPVIAQDNLPSEMLSDEAIEIQCQIFASGSASTYGTVLSNPHLTVSSQLGQQLTADITATLLNTNMFDFDTLLFKGLIPVPNIEYYVAMGVMHSFQLLQDPEFVRELSEIEEDLRKQAQIVLELATSTCETNMIEHRETEHGGEDPAAPVEDSSLSESHLRT